MGSTLYQFVGFQCPFLLLALLNIIAMVLMIAVPQATSKAPPTANVKQMLSLLTDRDIAAGLGS